MAQYEVEIKSLLGELAQAELLKAKLCELDHACVCVSTNKQLNHYFEGGNIHALVDRVTVLFSPDQLAKLAHMVEAGSDFSVRTRQKDAEVLLVVKASLDGGTSSNTVTRLEFEEPVSVTLDALDVDVQEAGYHYQAKWSREREEYQYKGVTVCIDKNAGYGYLAEFEKVVDDSLMLAETRVELEALMAELNVAELSQERLARMFDFYNQNWAEYYGTDKTFSIQ